MEPKDVIAALRQKHGFSQQALADQVFVTRQAVSRWESGETVPGPDTLKLLSRLFNVSINTLLGSPEKLICQCCGMPLEDSILSREPDGTPNQDYCQWCYADGEFAYTDLNALIDFCAGHMASPRPGPEDQVRAYLQATLPTLKHWKHPNKRAKAAPAETGAALLSSARELISALDLGLEGLAQGDGAADVGLDHFAAPPALRWR